MKALFFSSSIRLVALLLVVQTPSFSQTQDPALIKIMGLELQKDENGRGYFEFIDSTSGEKETLFLRAKQWIHKTYNSGFAVIQVEDKEAGLLECRGKTQNVRVRYALYERDMGCFKYNMTIRTKDDRYKITIYDFTYEKGELWLKGGADIAETYPKNWDKQAYGKSKEWWKSLVGSATNESKTLILALQGYMKKEEKSADDDW